MDDAVERDAAHVHGDFAGVHPRRVEQIAHHGLQLLDVAQGDFQIFLLIRVERSGNAVQQQRDELINRGQRRAQLVGHVGEQLVFQRQLFSAAFFQLGHFAPLAFDLVGEIAVEQGGAEDQRYAQQRIAVEHNRGAARSRDQHDRENARDQRAHNDLEKIFADGGDQNPEEKNQAEIPRAFAIENDRGRKQQRVEDRDRVREIAVVEDALGQAQENQHGSQRDDQQ